MSETVKLKKKVFIKGVIKLLTGMHVGGSDSGIEIGGIDKSVIRNPLNNQPYIPGSSIKGKMRSLLEKELGLEIHGGSGGSVQIHSCNKNENSNSCLLCRVFGLPAESRNNKTRDTRLIVRDAVLTGFIKNGEEKTGAEAVDEYRCNKNMTMPFTEVKTEVVIDRITSKAMPRVFERVPAGALFGLNLVCNIFEDDTESEIIGMVFNGLIGLQDDYIGGHGSRGYGQIRFDINPPLREIVFDGHDNNKSDSSINVPRELIPPQVS